VGAKAARHKLLGSFLMHAPIIINESNDPLQPGALDVYDSEESAIMALEPYDAGDPMIHVIDRLGAKFKVNADWGNSTVQFGPLESAPLSEFELKTLLRRHIFRAEKLQTIHDKIDAMSLDELYQTAFDYAPNGGLPK
jgi:hypothetical protein